MFFLLLLLLLLQIQLYIFFFLLNRDALRLLVIVSEPTNKSILTEIDQLSDDELANFALNDFSDLIKLKLRARFEEENKKCREDIVKKLKNLFQNSDEFEPEIIFECIRDNSK